MPRPISITTTEPSIVIVQGAYERFSVPAETESLMVSDLVAVAVTEFLESYSAFATTPPAEGWLKFQRLVDEWREQRGVTSSINDAVMCLAYQSIIGMGEMAVPFILAQLRAEGDDPDQWFWALKSITGADPVGPEDRGRFSSMARAWTDWGKRQGYAG